MNKKRHKKFGYAYILGVEKDARKALKNGDPILSKIHWNTARYLRKQLKKYFHEYAVFKKGV